MLGEDLKPWLIEINCSPTMARCTAVTTDMCDGVLEDTCKGTEINRQKSQIETEMFYLQ
jgi:tubulin monoglycylase TTLL3/8